MFAATAVSMPLAGLVRSSSLSLSMSLTRSVDPNAAGSGDHCNYDNEGC